MKPWLPLWKDTPKRVWVISYCLCKVNEVWMSYYACSCTFLDLTFSQHSVYLYPIWRSKWFFLRCLAKFEVFAIAEVALWAKLEKCEFIFLRIAWLKKGKHLCSECYVSCFLMYWDLCNFNKNDTKDERWMDARWYPALNAQFNEYQRRHEWHRAKLNAVFHLPFGYASFPSVDIMQQLTTMWEPYKPIRCLGDCSFPLYSACVRMCKLATAHSLPLENGSLKVGQEYHKQNTIQFWL
jgi:hypothetical protein